jgi:hypothetical protein
VRNRFYQNLGVTVTPESNADTLEFSPDGAMVVDLTVQDDVMTPT